MLDEPRPGAPRTIGDDDVERVVAERRCTSLFAAPGSHLGCFPRHRAVEFRRFLDDIAKAVPEDLDIHLVLDNYGTSRFHLHFTPTSERE